MSTMTDIPVTRSGTPIVQRLDRDSIRATETAAVNRTLDSIKDPKKRAAKAAAIIEEAQKVLDENEEPLRKMGASVALHEGARGVSEAIGMSRSGFYLYTERLLGDPVETTETTASGKVVTKVKYVWDERPEQWNETVAARAAAKGVRVYSDAVRQIPPLAAKVYAAACRKKAAANVRDQLILDLVRAGVTQHEVAEIVGRHRTRINHMVRAAGIAIYNKG